MDYAPCVGDFCEFLERGRKRTREDAGCMALHEGMLVKDSVSREDSVGSFSPLDLHHRDGRDSRACTF